MDRWTDRQTSCHGIVCAMHMRRVIKIGLVMFESLVVKMFKFIA